MFPVIPVDASAAAELLMFLVTATAAFLGVLMTAH
jgi:hypothetical protein